MNYTQEKLSGLNHLKFLQKKSTVLLAITLMPMLIFQTLLASENSHQSQSLPKLKAIDFSLTNGTLSFLDKSVIFKNGFLNIITDGKSRTQGFFYGNTDKNAFIKPNKFKNATTTIGQEKKTITYIAQIPLGHDDKTVVLKMVVTAVSRSRLQIKTHLQFENQDDRMWYHNGSILLKFPIIRLNGSTTKVGQWSHTYHWSKKQNALQKEVRHLVDRGTGIVMFAKQPKKSFVVRATTGALSYREYWQTQWPYAEIAIMPRNDVTAFTIDLPGPLLGASSSKTVTDLPAAEAKKTVVVNHKAQAPKKMAASLSPVILKASLKKKPTPYGGKLDLFRYEGIKTPDFSLSKNLIQNSSFEGGFHNWWPGRLPFTDLKNNDFISIDNQQAYRGKYSLHGKIQKGQCVFSAYHMAVPLIAGKAYTFSFYAKADRQGVKTRVLPVTDRWGEFTFGARIKLTTQWKRYSFPFIATGRIITIGIGEGWWENPNDQVDNANIWIDCVQLEEGKLTSYTEKPIQVELITGKFAQTYEASEPKHAILRIHNQSSQARKIKVSVQVKDFFDKVRKTLKFKLKVAAQSTENYSLDLSDVMGTGMYTLAIRTQSEAFIDTDYFRIAVIKPLDNTHQNKNLFSIIFQGRYWWAKQFDYLKRIGIGSVISGSGMRVKKNATGVRRVRMGGQGPYPQPFMYELAKKNRILTLASIFYDGSKAGDIDFETPEAYTDEAIAKIEKYCMKKAKQYPNVMYWKLLNEPDAKGIPDRIDEVDMAKLVRAMLAARRGIRKGNPKAKVSSPDPFNMYAAGRNWLKRYIEAGGDKTFDIAAIHTYRPTPESPDLDADASSLIQMLDDLGYAGDIWWTEGMLWYPYTIPELATTVYEGNSASHAFFGTLSYDLGRSEKIAAAFVARHYLVALKYHKRVKMDLDWGTPRYFLDWNQTPRAFIYAANTLGNLLGNANYRQDVDLAENIHIYVFEDDQKQPVAALWNYDPSVDRFEKPDAIATTTFKQDEVTVVDFMLNPIAWPKQGNLKITIGSVPVFLIGKPNSLPQFIETLESMSIKGAVRKIFNITTTVNGKMATVTINSLLSKGFQGTATALLAKKMVATKDIVLKGKSNDSLAVDLTPFYHAGKITRVPLNLKVESATQEPEIIDNSFMLAVSSTHQKTIKIDGDLSDWSDVQGISLSSQNLNMFSKPRKRKGPSLQWDGDEDLSAILKTTWDEKGFYLALEVQDNVHDPMDSKGPSYWWQGDSLQVYFDTWANARNQKPQGYDNNDYVYNFALTAKGSKAYRSLVPEWQVAFLKVGIPETVQTSIKRIGSKTIYEIFFPVREIMPLTMTPGKSFGFALLLNDRDHDYRKQGLTLTPAGTEPHMHPELFPLWMLAK